jgi:hypothetical protein
LPNSLPSSTTPYTPSSFATNVASSSSGVVLEGIKEGVQGMGRFITAGLGSITHVDVAEGNTPVSSSTSTPTCRGNRRLSSNLPAPLRLKSGNNYGHESQSSSSTSASFTTVASSSTSASSFMLEPGTTQVLSSPFTSDETPNDHDEFGDFEEAPTQSLSKLVEQEENSEQVLMVHDTGATPTMSPNPHFQRRNRMEVEQKDPASNASVLDSSWDDGWTTSVAHTDQLCLTKPPKIKKPSSPGLALSSMPTNGTTPQSKSTWVENVGKKWGEIRESQT